MQKLIDKSVILGLCLLAFSFAEIGWVSIATMLTAVAVSALCSYYENNVPIFLCAGYTVLCLFIPVYAVFLPLIVYDSARFSKLPLRFCWIVAIPAGFFIGELHIPITIILSAGVAFLLHYRTSSRDKARDELFSITDSASEREEDLEQKNRDLLEKQDYEIRLATLAERNRIAREIHDNVGHLLTRSLLQVDALRITNSDDEVLKDELRLVRGTLSDAMDSIRSSVHELHSEAIDLRSRLAAATDGFEFCPVSLRYDADELPADVKYCFAAVVREALSNIAKHSSATEASVTVTEHPAFYQLLVTDNGSTKSISENAGIGLQNMSDRVAALGGVFRVDMSKGFRIFISVPKVKL